MIWVIVVILAFLLLIIGHELGHYITAQASKVKVLEFGIGIPPKIANICKTKTWTQITINAIPLWGFVRLKWENPQSEDFLEKDSFIKASFFRKTLILLWGILANGVIAYILLVIAFSQGVKPIVIIPDNARVWPTNSFIMPNLEFAEKNKIIVVRTKTWDALVEEVVKGGRAEEVGISSGSIILKITDIPVNNQNLKSLLAQNINKTFEIVRSKDKEIFQKQISCGKECLLGVIVRDNSEYIINGTKGNVIESITLAAKEMKAQTKITFEMLRQLIVKLSSSKPNDRSNALENLSWPVGATKIGSIIREAGWSGEFLAFIAILSLALAIFNLLPIPALDGGRLLSVIIQTISQSKPQKYYTIESYINVIFFVALLWLWVLIIIKDLRNFRWI